MTQGNKNQKQRKSSKPTVQHEPKKTTVPKVQKRLEYDAEAKCWRRPINENTDKLQITRSLQEQQKLRDEQIPETLEHFREIVAEDAPPTPEPTDEEPDAEREEGLEEEEDTYSVTLDASTETPNITIPFNSCVKGNSVWSMPQVISPRTGGKFEWEKPANVKLTKPAVNSTVYQVEKLEVELSKREEENQILRKQLLTAHRENMKLVTELKMCSGEKYDVVVRENVRLRTTVDRLTKQISRTWGQSRKDENSTLRKHEREEALERKHRQKGHSSARR